MDNIPPPPPSKDYLASIGKDDDGGTPEEPDKPSINLVSQIFLIIFSLVYVYLWGRFAAGFHNFLDPKMLCTGEGVIPIISCDDGSPREKDWFTDLWDAIKKTSKAHPDDPVSVKTLLLVPILYSVGAFFSPLIGALEGGKIGWGWPFTQWWGTDDFPFAILTYSASFWIAMMGMCVGFWGVSFELPLRVLFHLYSCEDCGLSALSPAAATVLYLIAMSSVWGTICLATSGHTIIKIVLGTIFLLSGFAVYSFANELATKH